MEKISREALYQEYENLLARKKYLEDDIRTSYETIEDRLTDYLTKTECKNDIIEDKCELDKIDNRIHEIENILKKLPLIVEIVNEDGTSVLEGYPVNPLEEKWKQLYPSIPKPEYSQVCDGYSCMWCGRCPKGSDWKVPEEDLELWNQYQEEVREYNRIHNPKMYQLIKNNKN